MEQGSRYIWSGRISTRNKEITVTVQREIVKYVIGTHQTLLRHFPEVTKFRQNAWRSWVDGEENSKLYQA